MDTRIIYFCPRCSSNLNNIWDKFYEGQLTDIPCKSCQQPTFEEHKYCISCGEIHYKGKDQRQISYGRKAISIYDVLGLFCCGAQEYRDISKTLRKSEKLALVILFILINVFIIIMIVIGNLGLCDN